MSRYCLERGVEETDSTIVHKLDCPHYDLASLLGTGHIINIGEFADSNEAVNFVRIRHPDAFRCLDCCHADLVVQPPARQAPRETLIKSTSVTPAKAGVQWKQSPGTRPEPVPVQAGVGMTR